MKTQPLKGMRDLLPREQALRDYIQGQILATYRAAGFQRISTPILEDMENLDKSDGGDNLNLIFKVLKRGDKLAAALQSGDEKQLSDMHSETFAVYAQETPEETEAPVPMPTETPTPTEEATAEPQQSATPAPDVVKTTQYQRMGGTPLAQMETLHEQNTDLVAWLTIDNVLDLPVVYRNNSYYLTHDFNKNKSTAGTVFLDENHPMTERTQNLLLHGHNMKDGTMFGRLAQYEKNLDYLKAHAFIDFSTLWHQEKYVIFAVLDVSLDTGSDRFMDYFAHPRFESDGEFESYIRRVQLASLYAIPMDVKPSDALLTLSTCLDENRLVVIARRQREGESRASLREIINMAVKQ